MPGFDDVFRRSSHVRFVENLREVISYGQMLHKTERRDWLEFLDIRTLPKRDVDVLKKRVAVNLHYYRVNYALVTAGLLAAVTVLWSTTPFFLIFGSFFQAVYMFQHLYLRPFRIFGRSFDHAEKKRMFAVLLPAKVIVMELVFGASLLPTIVFCASIALLVGAHAVLRPQSTRSRFGTMGTPLQASSLDVEDGGLSTERVKLYAPSADLGFGSAVSYTSGATSAAASAATSDSFTMHNAMDENTRRARNEAYASRRRQVIQRERKASRASGLAARNMWAEQTIVEEPEEHTEEATNALSQVGTVKESKAEDEDESGPAINEVSAAQKRTPIFDTDDAERESNGGAPSSKGIQKNRPNVHLHIPARAAAILPQAKNKIA